MNRVLITGVFGYLGNHLASHFKQHNYYVSGIGHANPDSKGILIDADEVLEADVTIGNLRRLSGSYDVVVHCAGSSSVSYSMINPYDDFKKSVETSVHVLEYIRINNMGARFLYPSSAGVYGNKPDTPIRENDELTPISPYGYHKRIVEELCHYYIKFYNLSVLIIRFFSIYGNGLTKQLIWDACNKLYYSHEKAAFSGTGNETRDFIHIRDAVALIRTASEHSHGFNIINGASGIRVKVSSVISMLACYLEKDKQYEFDNCVRAGDPLHYHADVSRMKALGFSPSIFLEKGLQEYTRWFKSIA